jgi:hypothetical protein
LVSAHAANAAAKTNFRFGPERLIIACAIVLSPVVVGSASLVAFNLRNQILSENERTLSNSALILAKQIEQTFATVEAVQKGFNEDIARLPVADNQTIEGQLAGHDVHLKLRHKIAGMPYVATLTIFDTRGSAINFSRQWPVPDINVVKRDYFKALARDPNRTSFLGVPVRDSATGNWIMPLARRILGAHGEFVGII